MNIFCENNNTFSHPDTTNPIRNHKNYKEAVERATTWHELLENEERRILEYLKFRRMAKNKISQSKKI